MSYFLLLFSGLLDILAIPMLIYSLVLFHTDIQHRQEYAFAEFSRLIIYRKQTTMHRLFFSLSVLFRSV